MDRAIFTLKLLLPMVILILYPKAESQWIPHRPMPPINPKPLCATQYALVNHACAMLPYTPVPPPAPPSPPPAPPSPDAPDSGHRNGRHGGHDHGHGHGGHHGHGHGHGHGHSHRHRRHENGETSVEEECCRWLKEVDSVCVCDLLVHLPPFLTRPVHNYTVVVDDTCDVTFACGSRLVQL